MKIASEQKVCGVVGGIMAEYFCYGWRYAKHWQYFLNFFTVCNVHKKAPD